MKALFINFSNHPSTSWMEPQLSAARQYGDIVDLPFPLINEMADEDSIGALAETYVEKIQALSEGEPCTVHVMGEMTFTYNLVNRLKSLGYVCVASTTVRNVVYLPDGTKQVRFSFCRFRRY